VVFPELAFAALYRMGPIPSVFVEPSVAANDELATGPTVQLLLVRVEAVLAPIPIAEVGGGDYPAHGTGHRLRWARAKRLCLTTSLGPRQFRDRDLRLRVEQGVGGRGRPFAFDENGDGPGVTNDDTSNHKRVTVGAWRQVSRWLVEARALEGDRLEQSKQRRRKQEEAEVAAVRRLMEAEAGFASFRLCVTRIGIYHDWTWIWSRKLHDHIFAAHAEELEGEDTLWTWCNPEGRIRGSFGSAGRQAGAGQELMSMRTIVGDPGWKQGGRKYSSNEDGDGPDWPDPVEWWNWPRLSPRELRRRRTITEETRRRKTAVRVPPHFAGGRQWMKAGGRIMADSQEIRGNGGVGFGNAAGGHVRCPFAIQEPAGLRLECMYSFKPSRHRDCLAHRTGLEGGEWPQHPNLGKGIDVTKLNREGDKVEESDTQGSMAKGIETGRTGFHKRLEKARAEMEETGGKQKEGREESPRRTAGWQSNRRWSGASR
jgi:hypothetical protein